MVLGSLGRHHARRAFAKSSTASRHLSSSSDTTRPKISWLDLRGAGISAVERLAMEELLLRHDPLERSWAIVGVHEPTENRLLNVPLPPHDTWAAQRKRASDALSDAYGHEIDGLNRSCAIIMGIGGKPEKLIDIDSAKNDGVLVLKRFSGGGTVVVDHSSLWTTFIGRTKDLPHVKPFPREIMQWSADAVFGPAFDSWNREMLASISSSSSGGSSRGREKQGNFIVSPLGGIDKRKVGQQTLVFQGKSCGISGGDGESLILPPKENDTRQQAEPSPSSSLPTFQLRQNDYVLGERKIGGNAQAIVKGGFLHHTSFLWDFDRINMEYLTLPDKRPEYRGDRSHDEFLVRLKDHYGKNSMKNSLFTHMKNATNERFEMEEVKVYDVLQIAADKFGGLQEWFDGKCRTKVVKL